MRSSSADQPSGDSSSTDPNPDLPSTDSQTRLKADRETRAKSFGGVASEYERGRPSYPPEAVEWVLGSAPLEVLDLGAGTGKLTEVLVAAGHRATAVEPLGEMREILAVRLPAVDAIAGTAEQLPLVDSSIDAVLVAAAFHWFDHRRALAEIDRVLRPSGVLGLFGNGFDVSRPWVAHLRRLLGPPALERPGHWPDPLELAEDYVTVEDREFDHAQTIDRAGLRDLACSRSSVATLAPHEREQLLSAVDRLWDEEPELVGKSVASLPWRTRVRRCRAPTEDPRPT